MIGSDTSSTYCQVVFATERSASTFSADERKPGCASKTGKSRNNLDDIGTNSYLDREAIYATDFIRSVNSLKLY